MSRLICLHHQLTPEQAPLAPVLPEAVAEVTVRRGIPAVLFDRPQPVVLVGPRDRQLPDLPSAAAFLADLGYQVLWRREGGTTVVLDPGCLVYAIIRPGRDWTQWREHFAGFTAGIRQGLARLGAPTEFGRADGAWCDGPYDLVVHGKKLVGLAQAIRQGYVLVGGVIAVQQDLEQVRQLLEAFYRKAGLPRRYSIDALTTLGELLGPSVTPESVEAVLVEALSACEPLDPDRPTPEEWQRAQALYRERLIAAPRHGAAPPARLPQE
ncbi:MAG: lipoate--protein ligase family protein [Firmicutes bacterium]|nr:lipoate--protein ligase family protein [Bacillota bacterium]